jgi:hypothetical protein
MQNTYTKRLFLLLIILILHFPSQAIQKSVVHSCTTLVASACAGCSYAIAHKIPGYIPPFIFVGMGSLVTVATYYGLQQFTPAGRIKRANILLNDIIRHPFARMHFGNDQAFFDAVQDIYLTDDLPLISAYNHLINLVPVMHHAFGLINKASAEVHKNSLLQKKFNKSLRRAKKLFRNISDAIKRIREHKDYLSQLAIYKESLLQEQQTIAQQQIANAQQEVALAKQGSTLLKWIKFFLGKK